MTHNNSLLAKSSPNNESIPTYAKLVPHLKAVERAGESIVEEVGEIILEQLDLPKETWLVRLLAAVKVACLCHDIGKANESFQLMVRGELSPKLQPARHELLSAILLSDRELPLRSWAMRRLESIAGPDSSLLMDCVIGAVAGHHLKLDEDWQKASQALKGGCGTDLRLLLAHPDLTYLFGSQLFDHEKVISLVEDQEGYLGSLKVPFKLESLQWRKRLQQDREWWRFAACVKALVAAADVAGSAMLPEKGNIRQLVRDSLSRRITTEDMSKVVAARLGDKQPRAFQSAIEKSNGLITLVEAGCGSGKTVGAYLWAKRHANNRKLFFCYPTTGTATEGFLGYVFETDIEAELVHSRASVDLEGISHVKGDEEDDDHLLRIESLRLWNPQAIVCTIDTVLALVRNNRRGLYNSPAILSGAFVLDELHAYDDKLLAGTAALMKALPGAKFLLMTASLPLDRKNFLLKNFPNIVEVEAPNDLEQIPRYLFRSLSVKDEAFEIASNAARNGLRVLWICNTVKRAQEVYDKCSSIGSFAVYAYHSRFKYSDRVSRHRQIVGNFDSTNGHGSIAVTTQVAEMSLDLDAHVLITEIAPMSSLVQRLGRLNRRVSSAMPGAPREAFFVEPEKALPYEPCDLARARSWLEELAAKNVALSQSDLLNKFYELSPTQELTLDTTTGWLDSGWFAVPEPIRDLGRSASVILTEDLSYCRSLKSELTKRSIPMNFHHKMKEWEEFEGNLIAPVGAINYCSLRGASLQGDYSS